MAGINLSGAIGMTGKRESVLSDVPSIIQQTGDYLAKARQEDKEKKAKLALYNAESGAKRQDDLSKFITANADFVSVNKQYQDLADAEIKKFASVNNDPQATQAQKDQAKYEAFKNIAQGHAFLKNVEQGLSEYEKDMENPIYDVSEQKKMLAGIHEIDYMNPQAPNNTNAAYDVPTPEQQAPIPQVEVRKPLLQMSYDEMRKEHPQGLTTSLAGKKRLINVTPAEAVENAVPKETWDASLDSDMNTQTHKLNQGNYDLAKATYINSVVSGKNNKSKVIQAGLQAEALRLIERDHQDFTPEQKIAFVNDFVEQQAAKQFDETAKPKIDAIAKDRNKDWQKSKGGSGKDEVTIDLHPTKETERITNQDWVSEPNVLKMDEAISELNKQIKQAKPSEVAALEKRKKNLELSKEEYRKANTFTVVARPTFVALSNAQAKFKDANNQPVEGAIVSPIITDKGDLKIELQSTIEDFAGDKKQHTRVVPLTPTNESILLQAAGDNKGKAAQQIAAAKVAAAKQKSLYEKSLGTKQKEKSVSSQSTSKPKETKVIPKGRVR